MLDFHGYTPLPEDDSEAPQPRANPKFRRLVHAYSRSPKIDMLTRAEERRLVHAWKDDQDPAALDTLVHHHIGFICKLSHEIARDNGMRRASEDMISEGVEHFIKAIRRYKPQSNAARLASFSRYHIAGAVLTYVLRTKHAFAFGTSSGERTMYLSQKRHEKAFRETHGHAFDFTDAADLAHMSEISGASIPSIRRVCHLKCAGAALAEHKVQIHAPEETSQPEARLARRELSQLIIGALRKHLATLSERNRDILVSSLMSDDSPARTRNMLAERHDITTERVGQIYRAALGDLRGSLNARGIFSAAS